MELPSKWNVKISEEMQKRIVSAGILAPIVLLIIFLGGGVYNTMIIAVAVIMSFEWKGIIDSGNRDITENEKQKWSAVGVAYVTVFASSLIYLRSLEIGFGIVLLMLLWVWATDIAAFFTGRFFKGPKIYVKISPNKTWSGLLGGMVTAGLIGAFASFFVPVGVLTMALYGAAIAIIAQIGDFFESWVKRSFGVKDSGAIIPGHGGIMDRLDGFVTAAPVFVIYHLLT